LLAFTAIHERGVSHHLRRLFVMRAAGGEPRGILPGFDRRLGEIAGAADGKSLFVSSDDPGATLIARVGLDGTGPTVLASDSSGGAIEMPYAGHGFSVARDGPPAYVRSGGH